MGHTPLVMDVRGADTILNQAYCRLYQKEECPYTTSVVYSNRFKPFGANIRYRKPELQINLSSHWKDVSDEIVVGLIQELLLKVWKIRPYPQTLSLDFYHRFLRELPEVVPKTQIDPELKDHFDSINENYFLGQLTCPNLRWGQYSKRRFGSYNFKTDTITLSQVLRHVDPDVLRYVLFHEMLHKLHKFEMSGSRAQYHTTRFKHLEKQYRGGERIERILQRIANGKYPLPQHSGEYEPSELKYQSNLKEKTPFFKELTSLFSKKK